MYRKRLINLHKSDPKCHWCKCVTVLYLRKSGRLQGGHLSDNAATLDHVFQKPRVGRGLTVLACHSCNQKRSKANMSDNKKFLEIL